MPSSRTERLRPESSGDGLAFPERSFFSPSTSSRTSVVVGHVDHRQVVDADRGEELLVQSVPQLGVGPFLAHEERVHRGGQDELTLPYLRRALDLSPRSPEANLHLGLLLVDTDRSDDESLSSHRRPTSGRSSTRRRRTASGSICYQAPSNRHSLGLS